MILDHYYLRDYLNHVSDFTDSKLNVFDVDGFLINFFVKVGKWGKVVNSSPFFGSHGGFYKAFEKEVLDCKVMSMDELAEWLTQHDVASVTIVENPYCDAVALAKNQELIDILKTRQIISYDIITRFSSVKWLKNITDSDTLMMSYHSKTRNCLRKYLKSGAYIETYNPTCSIFNERLLWIANEHRRAIEAKNGVAKPLSYFQTLSKYFHSDRLEVKVSFINGEPIGGLLNFKTGNQTEYWVPVVTDFGRANNAIYGMIDDTLKNAINKEGALLNFGGSWSTQNDLQRFKSRFGSKVCDYKYHCFVQSGSILNASSADLLGDYPYFFIRRFS